MNNSDVKSVDCKYECYDCILNQSIDYTWTNFKVYDSLGIEKDTFLTGENMFFEFSLLNYSTTDSACLTMSSSANRFEVLAYQADTLVKGSHDRRPIPTMGEFLLLMPEQTSIFKENWFGTNENYLCFQCDDEVIKLPIGKYTLYPKPLGSTPPGFDFKKNSKKIVIIE